MVCEACRPHRSLQMFSHSVFFTYKIVFLLKTFNLWHLELLNICESCYLPASKKVDKAFFFFFTCKKTFLFEDCIMFLFPLTPTMNALTVF